MMKSMIPLAILLAASAVFAQQDVVKHAAELAENSKKIMEIERESFARKFITLGKIALPDSVDYDQLYYDLNFTITTSPDNLAGAVHGVFKSNINGLTEIKLNFDSREGLTPWADFSVTGNVTSYTHSDWVLRVTLDQTYNVGDTFAIDVTYSGVPREGGFKAFSFDLNNYNEPIISTLSEPYFAQTWWPCKDDPGDKLDSVRITVTVPDQFIVASNGLLESELTNPNSTKTFIWNERYPITTYLVSLAISNYAVFADSFEYVPGKFMPIEYFVYPQNYNTAQTAFQLLPDMLAVYSKLYGLYPFINEKYGQAEFDWGGAMEHQTCTSIGRVSTSWETAYAHELSHQWFGDLVTCHDWGNIWLNEGFATYSEALWMEFFYGDAAFQGYVNNWLSPGNFTGIFVDPVYRYDTSSAGIIFSSTVYIKGGMVLHMLRHVVGDSTFFEIMHDYPNAPQFAFKDATTEQFRDYCEMKSGMDLDWFFQQWIYESYYPVYRWGYTYYRQNTQDYLHVRIDQIQDSLGYDHFYKMPIDLVVNYSSGQKDTVVVWDSLKTQTFEISINGTPSAVTFDPENWILKQATQSLFTGIGDKIDLTSTFALYQNFPNPFNLTTRIPFSLDTSGQVKLNIYDITGRKIRTLIDGYYRQGDIVTWDGRDDHDRGVASGIYVYQIRFQNRMLSKKMVLIR